MPDNELRLKVGCPVILLRNVSAGDGLVNGTRMIVTDCHWLSLVFMIKMLLTG